MFGYLFEIIQRLVNRKLQKIIVSYYYFFIIVVVGLLLINNYCCVVELLLNKNVRGLNQRNI